MKITEDKKITIFTIMLGIATCGFLLFWCGKLSSAQGEFIQQNTQLGINLLLLIICMWLLGFIIYKVASHEKSIEEIKRLCTKIAKLSESNSELLQYIIKQDELDFNELQNFNRNNRELLLGLYYESGGNNSDKKRTMETTE